MFLLPLLFCISFAESDIEPVFEVTADDWAENGNFDDTVGGLQGTVTGTMTLMEWSSMNAVYIGGDNDYIEWPLQIGPSGMPQASLEILVWLPSIANNRGWVFGDEDGGCDRYILLHDNRVGGLAASCLVNPGQGNPPTEEWIHIIATYDQSSTMEGMYLNGQGSTGSGGSHSDGRGALRLGSPWGSHHGEMYFNMGRVYNVMLTAEQVQARYMEVRDGLNARLAAEPARWSLGMNLNPCDGSNFGYGSPYWTATSNVGSSANALTNDYVNSDVWSAPASFITIARHSSGVCQMSKTWGLSDDSKSMHDYFSDVNPGRIFATGDGTENDNFLHSDMPDSGFTNDPIFGADGGLVLNWWYSNNGARIAVPGGYKNPYHLPGTDLNNDDVHGLGNEFGASTQNGEGSSAWWHDAAFLSGDCHGGSCNVVGTDHGSSLNHGECIGSYAIYLSQDDSPFRCQGQTLTQEMCGSLEVVLQMTASDSRVDDSVPGVLTSTASGGWTATAYSDYPVTDSVTFKCTHNHIMPGLQKTASTTSQSYASLDYGFCCRPSGTFEVWENGAQKYIDTEVYGALTSVLELRIVNNNVQYIVDGRVAYVSTTPIADSESVHFACSFHDHPAQVTDIAIGSTLPDLEYCESQGLDQFIGIGGARWEYTANHDCGGNDIISFPVPKWGTGDYLEQRKTCAEQCLSRTDCVAFNYPASASTANFNCYMKRSVKQSSQLGETCGGSSNSWQYYTLLDRHCDRTAVSIPFTPVYEQEDGSVISINNNAVQIPGTDTITGNDVRTFTGFWRTTTSDSYEIYNCGGQGGCYSRFNLGYWFGEHSTGDKSMVVHTWCGGYTEAVSHGPDIEVNDGEWHAYAHVWDGSQHSVYVDGQLYSQSQDHGGNGPLNTGSSGCYFGAQWDSRFNFVGDIKDAKVYKDVLNADQISALAAGSAVNVCELCSSDDCSGEGACLLIEGNGAFTCEVDASYFTSNTVCDNDGGHWCAECPVEETCTARYWRFTATEGGTYNTGGLVDGHYCFGGYGSYGFAIYDATGTRILPQAVDCTECRSSYGDSALYGSFTNGQHWCVWSPDNDGRSVLTITFAEDVQPTEYKFDCGGSSNCIVGWTIEASSDGSNWNLVETQTDRPPNNPQEYTMSSCYGGSDSSSGLLIMKMKAGSDVFDYESSYWTNLETLNPDERTASESDDIDAKLEAFNEVPLDALKICYGELENCYTYDLGQMYDSAQVLFSNGYIRDLSLGGTSPDAAKQAWTDIFIPPTDSMYNDFWNGGHGHSCAMQRPGINTQCNDNNWARVGYCVNLPAQSCQQYDSHDADSPIGIGLKTQNWPNNVNAPFGEYALHGIGNHGVQERQKQVWVFIPGAGRKGRNFVPPPSTSPTRSPTSSPTSSPSFSPTSSPTSSSPSLSPTLPYCSAFECGDSNDAVHIPNAGHVFGNDFATCCKCQFGNDILWGAHASGVFHDHSRLVEMWVEIPVDVDMQRISWKNSRNNDLQFVKGTTSDWEYEDDEQCRARWVLQENLGTFFSAATHFTYDKTADVLEGMVEFEADRKVTRSTSGHRHSFIRHITQDIVVQFSLEKRTNVSATFSTGVGPQYADIAITGIAEKSFAENGDIVLDFNILSSSCMNSSVTRLTSGQQYVDGSLNVEWSEKSMFQTDNGTSCSQDVTVRFQRQSGEYNLELVLQFKIQGGDYIETTVNLHIEEPSILDTLPIEATMSYYLTEARATTADSFGLGHVVYGRIRTSTVVSVDYIGVTSLFLEQMGYDGEMERHDIMNVDWSGYSGAYVSPDKFDFSFVLNTTELHITAEGSGDDHLANVIADIEVTYLDESSTAGRRRRLAVGTGSDMTTSSRFKISDGNDFALVAVESANKQHPLLPYAALGGALALTFYCVRTQMKLQDEVYFPLLIDDDGI